MIDENYVKQLENDNEMLRKTLEHLHHVEDDNAKLKNELEIVSVFEKAIKYITGYCYELRKVFDGPVNIVSYHKQFKRIELRNTFPPDDEIFNAIHQAHKLSILREDGDDDDED